MTGDFIYGAVAGAVIWTVVLVVVGWLMTSGEQDEDEWGC